jgi:hypothetical protein
MNYDVLARREARREGPGSFEALDTSHNNRRALVKNRPLTRLRNFGRLGKPEGGIRVVGGAGKPAWKPVRVGGLIRSAEVRGRDLAKGYRQDLLPGPIFGLACLAILSWEAITIQSSPGGRYL